MAGPFYASPAADATNPGDDGDSGLTLALAKATLSAAYLLTSAAGEVVNVNSGTFAAENTSGTTRMHFSKNVGGAGVTVQAINGASKPIIYGGTLATYSATMVGGPHTLVDLVFRPNHTLASGAGNTAGIIQISTNATTVTMTRVEFDSSTVAGVGATPQQIVYSGTGPFTLTMTDCTFTPMADQTLASFATSFNNPTNGVILTATGLTCNFPKFSVNGCRAGSTVTNSTFACTAYAPFIAGLDADTGGATTAVTVSNCTFSATGAGSHGLLIGHGATGCVFNNCTVTACGDYALVIKSCSGNTVNGGYFPAGASAGKSAVLYKGSEGNTVTGATLVANGSGRRCLNITANDAATDPTGETVTRCKMIVLAAGELYLWPTAEDGGGNLVDRNLIHVTGGSTYGTVYGVECKTLAQLRTVWNTGAGAGNDKMSRKMNTPRHHGQRNLRQRRLISRAA
jgi:hypothetical protein